MLVKFLVASSVLLLFVACKEDGTPIEQATNRINYCSEDSHCVTVAQQFNCDPLAYNKNEDPSPVLTIQNQDGAEKKELPPRCRPSLYKIRCEENKCIAQFHNEVEVE